jgi:hypothetical protein
MANTTNRLIWWALIASIGIYAAVAYMIAGVQEPRDGTYVHVMAAALGVVSMTIAVVTIFIRGRMLVGPIKRGELDPRTPAGLQRAFVPFLLCLVLSESVGIYGLVLALLSGISLYAAPFLVIATVLLLIHRPTAPELVPPRSGAAGHLDASPIG